MSERLKVLAVEDSETDWKLIERALGRAGYRVESERVEDSDAMRAALARTGWDLIVSDWTLPRFSGPQALATLQAAGLDIPFIIVSGTIGEETAVRALQAGASDFMLKDKLARLAPAVERVLRDHDARKARQRAEEALRLQSARFRALIEKCEEGISLVSADGTILYLSPAGRRIIGLENEDRIGRNGFELVHPDDLESVRGGLEEMVKHRVASGTFQYRIVRPDGSARWIESVRTNLLDDPSVGGIVENFRDVTDRKRAIDSLRADEARYRILFDFSPLPKWLFDVETLRFLAVNETAVRHYGYSRDEFLGMTIKDIRPLEEVPAVVEFVRSVTENAPTHRAWKHRKKDGTIIDVEVSGHTFSMEGRTCRLVVVNDVTERKRAELERFERVEIAALGADVGIAVTRSDSLRDMLQGCTEALVRRLDAASARIWTLNPDQGVLELQAGAGLYSHIEGELGRVPVGKLEIGKIAEERQPHMTNNLVADPGIGCPEARREGMVAFAGHPLLIAGDLVGVMALFARHPLSEATLKALASIADAIALGIRRKTVESARSALETQLRQVQKIEAIGQLTGGIAHDFNNLLTVILSRAFFLLEELGGDDPRRADAAEIKSAAERASALTRQLLAFSRKQVLEARVLDLNALIAGLEKMLRRLIGEDIALSIEAADDLGSVKADVGQLEQVIVNLVVNARDAMPIGGKLTLKTSNVRLDEDHSAINGAVVPGPYVLLSVSDTGSGMTPEVQQHLFEPFFTTKEKGKGTGLGLSTSYGIVKQSGGHIWVHSEPGQGTVFRIYLPRVHEAPQGPELRRTAQDLRGSETILLVDDHDQVRSTAQRILEARGYAVLAARSGPEAIAKASVHRGPIHLVLSDIVMPGESGPQLVQHLRAARPEMAVLLMSGFSEHAVVEKAVAEGADHLQKPFTPDTLAERVRAILDRAQGH